LFEVLDRHRVPVNERERSARLARSPERFPYFGATGQVGEIDEFLFEGESVLLGEDGAPFLEPARRKAYLVSGKYWVNNHAHILRAWSPHSNAYFCHQLNAIAYTPHVSGTTRLKLTQAAMVEIELRVPPAPEQQRIVSRIEELFSEIDEGERALERVGQLVRRYRQSVLKAAVTGELTREWRAAHANESHGTASNGIATDTLGVLPSSWHKLRVDEAGEVQLGRQRSPDHHQGEHMRPYLRVANVFEERIDTSDVMSMNFTPDEYERFQLRVGDIFLNEGQSKELVGRPAMYRGELPGGCFTNSLVRFRCRAELLPEFAMCVFLHFMKSGHFQKIAKITTNIAHLGAGRFAEMAFPLPPLDEQRVIVDRVATQASVWRALLDDVSVRKRHASSLRQSILKAAFSGQLVPQDPSDEPASALLARLATQSAAAPPAPKRRGRQVPA
jgi:type I restriction enzyme S subunit